MFGRFLENLRIALSAILSNKMRALLTTLGIIIGILSVTLMGTLISGLDRAFERSISFMSRDVLFVTKFSWFHDDDWWEIRNRKDLEPKHAERIQELSQYAAAAAPVTSRMSTIRHKDRSIMMVRTSGTTDQYMLTSPVVIEEGRFFTAGESRAGTPVCVIGYDVKERLFENKDPIGKKVKFGNNQFRVIGVIARQGKFLGLFSLDNQAIIPIGTFQKVFSRRGWTQLSVKVDGEHLAEAKDELTFIMRRLRGLGPREANDFAINQQESFRTQYNTIKFAIGGTGVFITILSLIVGGIGIMNIMFVSVKERTREIGIRKALGATPLMILGQFLMEAVIICGIAGLIGLGLSYLGSTIIDRFFPSTMPVALAVAAFVLSLFVGVAAGLAPSYRAAKLDPIVALRYE